MLDIGCGNGLYARRLAALGAEVYASDFSANLIERAKARTTEHVDRIHYQVLDATDEAALLSLGEGRFDKAMCNMVLFDVADIVPLARALPRLLKPGGQFVFSVIHPCFNNPHTALAAERVDHDGQVETNYWVRVPQYIRCTVSRAAAIAGQPEPQLIFHRPLEVLLETFFETGFVLDALREPTFPADEPSGAHALGWGGNYRDIPPALVARVRLPG